MSDAEKVKLIQKIYSTAWEAVPQENEAAYWRGIMVAIESVVEGYD